MNDAASLVPFFNPAGVVILGATQNPTKLGFVLTRNLAQCGYRGAVHFVNPGGGQYRDHPFHRRVADVPDPVDLAMLLIPAPAVPQALTECGQRGIRAVIIASGGFRETGPAGAELEEICLTIAQKYQMRLIGPNCIGLLDTHLPLDTTFLPPPGPTPGDVAFISHSGAICAAVTDWARGQGFGLSRLISLGNQADVCETDMLAPVAADSDTRVITLYLEGVRDGRRFVAEAAQAARQKPLIVLKVGRSESGRRAVASHTGALAGQESALEAAFRRAGVLRADTSEALFDWARALAWCAPPAGRGVAVLTNAGGPGITAADALEGYGLYLADLQPATQQALVAMLPPAASTRNPVDMLASATPQDYADALHLLLADPGVHSVLVIVPPPLMSAAGGVARALIPLIHTGGKPVVVALMGERMIQEAVEHFRSERIPEYRFPERAASALAVLVQRAEFLAREETRPGPVTGVDPAGAQAILNELQLQPGEFLPQKGVQGLLAAYGIATPPAALARTAAEAVALAQGMGFPVALKIAAPDVVHKSDVGGLLLNLTSPEAVSLGFAMLLDRVQAARPGATIWGATVQKMIPAGQEVIVGCVQDPQFGPVLMFGSGGVEVEGLQDVAFALAPPTADEVDYLLAQTWAGRKLAGYRSLPPADEAAVRQVLVRLGQLAADFPALAEIEINPLRVLPAGAGAVALDVRARLRS